MITPFGYIFFAVTLFSVALTYAICWRARQTKPPMGFFSGVIIWIVIWFTSLMMLFLPSYVIDTSHGLITYPRYDAEVISVSSKWETFSSTDSDGYTTETDVLMHTPTFRFTDGTGETIVQQSNVSSGDEPFVGDIQRVAYQDGHLIEASFGSYILLFGGALFLTVFGYFLICGLAYAAGFKMDVLLSLGLGFLLKVLIPVAMLGMLAGLCFGVYEYLIGESDMSGIIAVVISFFAIMLVLGFLGYVKALWAGGDGVKTTKSR